MFYILKEQKKKKMSTPLINSLQFRLKFVIVQAI